MKRHSHRSLHFCQRLLVYCCMLQLLLCALPMQTCAAELKLRVGVILPLTGMFAQTGDEMKKGAMLAGEDLLQAADLRLEMIVEDSKYDGAAAVSAFNKLRTADNLDLFYSAGTPVALAIKPAAEKYGVLLFSSLSGSSQIAMNSRFVLRHGSNPHAQAQQLAEALLKDGVRSIGLVTAENDFALDVEKSLRQAVDGYPQVSIKARSHLPGETDFRPLLTPLLREKPDVFMVNSVGTAAGLIMVQLRQLGFAGPMYGTTGLAISPEGLQIVRAARVAEAYYASLEEPPAEFKRIFKERYKEEPSFYALLAYTDCELLGYAARHAGPTPDGIVRYVKSLPEFRGRYATVQINPAGEITEATVIKKIE
jgi:branched-chain amino acid transport system substrate-binding protein